MFYTIRPLPALLQVRCRVVTNVRTFLPHTPTFCTLILQNVLNTLILSVKKSTHTDVSKAERGPRTEQDERFLILVTQIMKSERINSERAFSLEIGRGPDFISRIRRGIQSAPADAWDTLLSKYPEARNISTTNVMVQGGGQAIGNVEGDSHYHAPTLAVCQQELAAAKTELERLRQQVADQERLIASQAVSLASKEEIISLLRGGYNRPN